MTTICIITNIAMNRTDVIYQRAVSFGRAAILFDDLRWTDRSSTRPLSTPLPINGECFNLRNGTILKVERMELAEFITRVKITDAVQLANDDATVANDLIDLWNEEHAIDLRTFEEVS